MVYLYTCNACVSGDHKNCELSIPMETGDVSGGSICRCGCRGNAEWGNLQKNIPIFNTKVLEELRNIEFIDEESEKEDLKLSKGKKK